MNIKTATNVITALLNDADYLARYRTARKNFVEFAYHHEEFAVGIYLRPVGSFRRFNDVGVHALAETKDELINQLGNSIEVAHRDGFVSIHLYCLPDDFLNNSNEVKNLA